MRARVYQEVFLLLLAFFLGGVLIWWLTDVVSRSDIGGDGWSLRGNGALIVPVVLGPALMASGWAALSAWFKRQPRGPLAALLAGLATIALVGAAGFAPVLLRDWRVGFPSILLAFGAGVGLAALVGRPGRGAVVLAVALLLLGAGLGLLAGGSLPVVAPLLVPLQVALPLVVTRPPGDTSATAPGVSWQVAAYAAVPVAVIGGFIAATRLGS